MIIKVFHVTLELIYESKSYFIDMINQSKNDLFKSFDLWICNQS